MRTIGLLDAGVLKETNKEKVTEKDVANLICNLMMSPFLLQNLKILQVYFMFIIP